MMISFMILKWMILGMMHRWSWIDPAKWTDVCGRLDGSRAWWDDTRRSSDLDGEFNSTTTTLEIIGGTFNWWIWISGLDIVGEHKKRGTYNRFY